MKKLNVLGIGARPSPFDEVDTHFIQLADNTQLIHHGEGDALLLRSIPQGSIMELDFSQLLAPNLLSN